MLCLFLALVLIAANLSAQDQAILVPEMVPGSPYVIDDSQDLFGKAWRFYREGFSGWAADSLRKLLELAGLELNPKHYYIVVANFNPAETPIGMFHGDADFLDTRLYGLQSDSLFYIFISRDETAKSYLSAMITRKESYFEQNLLNFIGLFPIFSSAQTQVTGEFRTWIDVRKFKIPEKFQKNCDISIIVKKDFYDERSLAKAVFDNTSLERWSYGIATAITTVNDVDFTIDNGVIVVRPKPIGDFATFGVINYHFKPVDTKAKRIDTSFHLLGGLRISTTIEPILGLGFGIPVSLIDLHLFAGYSVEFAQTLKEGYKVNQLVEKEVDPFKLKIRGKPRIGIEVKFP